jgi:hypothetical protein
MRKTSILVAACLSLLASAAAAGPREDAKIVAFAQRMFATKSFDNKVHACFVRSYDAAHLARHRGQKVTAMKMLIAGETLKEDGELSFSYDLGINFRDRKGDYVSDYNCGHARLSDGNRGHAEVSCHDGCEEGGVLISLAPDAKSIIVKVMDVGVTPADKPGDQDAWFSFQGGSDDRVFRLDRVDMENCKSLMKDDDKKSDEVAVAEPE